MTSAEPSAMVKMLPLVLQNYLYPIVKTVIGKHRSHVLLVVCLVSVRFTKQETVFPRGQQRFPVVFAFQGRSVDSNYWR
jgi:hypothetical protein